MTTDKHPAEALADKISPAGTHSLAWCKDSADMLRRIPALEAERAMQAAGWI